MFTEKVKKIASWCFSVFCILSILAMGPSLGTVLLLICGILALPIKPVKSLWEKILPNKRNWIKILSLCLVFFIGLATTPTSQQDNSIPDVIEKETTDNGISSESDVIFTTKNEPSTQEPQETLKDTAIPDETPNVQPPSATTNSVPNQTSHPTTSTTVPNYPNKFNYGTIPPFDGKEAYYVVNNNNPYFSDSDFTTLSYENYSARDSLNRCGTAVANIGKDLMPTSERGSIGMVKPSGWQTVKYDCVDGNYLYNRCHLIGFQLTGENANEDNLITGTRFMNNNGMLPFENMVADYVKETNNHVLYRVTPIFIGNELLARGVLMEAYSVEDNGDGICFNVFCYNAQPQININYSNGNSSLIDLPIETQPIAVQPNETKSPETQPHATQPPETKPSETQPIVTQSPETKAPETIPVVTPGENSYVVNINTDVYHYPSCSSVKRMKESNKWFYTGTSQALDSMGYRPCQNCNPH